MDIGWQRVGVGAFQLRKLAPFEQLDRQTPGFLGEVFAGGQIVQDCGAGAPRAGARALAAGIAELSEQDFRKLLRRADVECLARELVDLGFDLGQPFWSNSPERRASSIGSILMPRAFHFGEHVDQRTLQPLVHRRDAFGRKTRAQHVPEPQRKVGLLGGELGRLGQADAVEADLRLAGTAYFLIGDRLMPEMALGQLVHAMRSDACVERIGHEEDVVHRRHIDVVTSQHLNMVFEIVPDLEDASVLSEPLQQLQTPLRTGLARSRQRRPDRARHWQCGAPAARSRRALGSMPAKSP